MSAETIAPNPVSTVASASTEVVPSMSISPISVPEAISSSICHLPTISAENGGSFKPGFSLAELKTLPEHTVSIESISSITNPFLQANPNLPSVERDIQTILKATEVLQTKPERIEVVEILNPFLEEAPIVVETDLKTQDLAKSKLDIPKTEPKTPRVFKAAENVQSIYRPAEITRLAESDINTQTQTAVETKVDEIISIELQNAVLPKPELRVQPIIKENAKIEAVPEEAQQSIKVYELQVDQMAATTLVSQILEDRTLTEEEKIFWIQKVQNAVGTKTEVKVDIEEKVEEEIVLRAQTETKGANQPPKKTGIGITDESEKPASPEAKEPDWKIYEVTENWQVSKDSLNKRLKVTSDIVESAQETKGQSVRTGVEAQLYKLDVPNPVEAISVLRGKKRLPVVTLKAQAAISFVDENDPQQIHKAVASVVTNTPPEDQKKRVECKGEVKQSKLPKDARDLAEQGARAIIQKGGRFWKSVKRLPFTEPHESERSRKVA